MGIGNNMGWSNYNINWESPEYWKSDCIEALRQAVLERMYFYRYKDGQYERTFAQINNTFAVDRESGEISFTHDYYNNNNFTIGSRDPGIIPATNPIMKPVNLQKLNFHQYTQIGHGIDAAIQRMVYSSAYMWVRWWELDNFEGVTRPPDISASFINIVVPFSTGKARYRYPEYGTVPLITEITDILEYIGDDRLYQFSDYGDNTKWARQKYQILNALKMLILYDNYSNKCNAMGAYTLHRSGLHNTWYSKSYDNNHPGDPDYNSEWEGGDLPVISSSLDAVLAKAVSNSKSPYYDSDGASLTASLICSFYSSFYTDKYDFPDNTGGENNSSRGTVSYDEYHAGALTTRSKIPLNVDTYIWCINWDYTGTIGNYTTTKYSHSNTNPEYQKYPPLENWNPYGLPDNEFNIMHLLKSYRLEPGIDFQDTVAEIVKPSFEIPSLPSTQEESDGYYHICQHGEFSMTYYYMALHIIKPEFEFQG